jgi:hypothetical protein
MARYRDAIAEVGYTSRSVAEIDAKTKDATSEVSGRIDLVTFQFNNSVTKPLGDELSANLMINEIKTDGEKTAGQLQLARRTKELDWPTYRRVADVRPRAGLTLGVGLTLNNHNPLYDNDLYRDSRFNTYTVSRDRRPYALSTQIVRSKLSAWRSEPGLILYKIDDHDESYSVTEILDEYYKNKQSWADQKDDNLAVNLVGSSGYCPGT